MHNRKELGIIITVLSDTLGKKKLSQSSFLKSKKRAIEVKKKKKKLEQAKGELHYNG